MTDEKLDLLLRQALNLEIADHDIQIDAAKIKSDRNTTSWKYWKHFPAAAASVAVLTLSSMMVCAALLCTIPLNGVLQHQKDGGRTGRVSGKARL